MCFSCFASENGVMLPAPPDSLQTWRPRAIDYRVMCDSLNRVGGMLNRYDIRRNIDLIRSLYPQVENIALVTDNTYGGISLQALVRAEWENYPDLNLVLVDSREGEETAFRTYATLPPRSAVMLGKWRVGSDGEFFMQRSLNDLVQNNPRVPVFSVTGTGIGDMAIGGYVPEYENGAEIIAGQIRKYYDTDSIEDAHFHTSKSLYLFDSRKLKEWKIAEYALPKGSVIEDTMAAKLSKYSHYIELLVLGILLLVLLLFFVTWLLLRMRRLKLTLEEREGQLVVAREKAEESDMLKSAFLANMSHEIRTPLNAIVGFAKLIGSAETEEEKEQFAEIIDTNSELLLQLINDILDLSKIEAGTLEFRFRPMNLNELCRSEYEVHKTRVKPGVELVFEEKYDDVRIVCDQNRLAQVITNLLNNAAKFTEKGSIRFGFDVCGDRVEFYVQDTGMGIPPEKARAIFDRFVKLNDFASGTGLGLAISKMIVERMDGEISVDSEEGRGTRFRFSIPVEHRDLPSEGAAGASSGESGAATRWTLLVGEDSDRSFRLIEAVLNRSFKLVRAVTGTEVVELFGRVRPDAVLMDLRLPVMDGLEATRRIRALSPGVPIVAMSAYSYVNDVGLAKEAGCNEFLIKPLSQYSLNKALNSVLVDLKRK